MKLRQLLASSSLQKAFVGTATLLVSSLIFANPVGGNVTYGNATIQQAPNSTVINQTSQKAIINWQSFNINSQESTHFQQPAGGIALNRISPTDGASAIYGRLTATGQIILVNPAGIFFGPSSYVNVGGLIATTANITDQNFINGIYQFSKVQGYSGSVINQGTIIAADHGLVALVGSNVSNEGMIQANLGHIVLATGDAYTVSLAGNDLIHFAITQKSSDTGKINNTGSLIANGGTILISANTAQQVLDNVINMEGIAQIKSIDQQNGELILSGDADSGVVRVAANIDASGVNVGETGGTVSITGHNVFIDTPTYINANGSEGGGNIYIGGNYHGEGPLPNANAIFMAANTKISADALSQGKGGNIILWSDKVTKAYGNISAMGGASGGDGGFVETSSHGYLDVNGIQVNTSAKQGQTGTWLLDPADLAISALADNNVTGSSPFEPASPFTSSNLSVATLTAALAANNVTVQTGGDNAAGSGDINVSTNISWSSAKSLTLSAYRNITFSGTNSISNSGGASVVLRADNTGTGTGTVSFGTGNVTASGGVSVYYNPTTFGTQDTIYTVGLGTTPTKYMLVNQLGASTDSGGTTNTRSLATISNTSTYWNKNFALAKDIDASATSGWNGGLGFVPIGNASTAYSGLFDGNNATISNLFINRQSTQYVGLFGRTSGTIQNIGLSNEAITGSDYTGGLVGSLEGGTVFNSHTSGSITQHSNTSFAAGGLVGAMTTSTINSSYSTANVTQTDANSLEAGGLSGGGDGTITNSYSTGTVTSAGSNGIIGGLVGTFSGSITSSFSSSNVSSAGNAVGGLVGSSSGSITDSYALGNVSGQDSVGGLVGSLTSSTVNNAYSIGAVSGTGANVGGLVGSVNLVTVNNSFWDVNTSGKSTSIVGTAGCFSGGACGATMNSQGTYTGVGWDFANTWGIVSTGAESYPYLKTIFTSTPRIFSGSTPAALNSTVKLVSNGTVIDSRPTYNDGSFYYQVANGTIADSNDILVYLSGAATKGNVIQIAPTSGGSLSGSSGLSITANTVQVGNSLTNTFSNSILDTAKGSLSDSDILYSVSGNNVTLGNGSNVNVGLNTTATSTYDIDGNITAGGTGNLVFNGPVSVTAGTLLSPATLTATLGSITFNNSLVDALSNTHYLTATANTVNFNTDVGTSGPLNNLTVNATTINDNADNLDIFSANFNGALVINAPSLFANIQATGPLSFGSTINGLSTNQSLQLFIYDTLSFNGDIGANTPLDTFLVTYLGGSTAQINFNNTSQVTTLNNQSYTNFTSPNDLTMTLGNDLTLTTTNGGHVNINGGVARDATARALTINTGAGDILIKANVGSVGAELGALNFTSSGTTTLGDVLLPGNIHAASLTTDSFGTTLLEEASITTSGTQTYNDIVTLGADTLLSANGITFANTLDTDGTPHSLSVSNLASGITFSKSVGATNPLSSISIGSGSSSVFGANSGSLITVNTTGTQTYNNSIRLNDDTTFNTSNSPIAFNSPISSFSTTKRNLTVSSGSGDITTSGFGDVFGQSLNAILLQSSGTTIINGNGVDIHTLTTDAVGTTQLNGVIIAVGAGTGITFNDPVVINSGSAGLLTNGAPITFASTLDTDNSSLTAEPLTIQTNNILTFAGQVGANNPLSTLTISSFITNGTIAMNGGSIKTSGAQTYSIPILLGADTILTSTLDSLNFSSTINSDATSRALTLDFATNANLSADIGGSAALASIDTSSTNPSASIVINNALQINTVGNQVFNQMISFPSQSLTLTSSAGAISLLNTVNGGNLTVSNVTGSASSGSMSLDNFTKNGTGLFDLQNSNTFTNAAVLNSGTLLISNALGLGTSGATINSGAILNIATNLNSAPITMTNGTLTSTGDASLAGAINLTTGTNDIISNNNLNTTFTLFGNINGAASLFFQGAGDISLIGNIGNSTPVVDVTTTANTMITGSVTSSSSQNYGSPITLTANTNLISTGGNITFNNSVNGAFDLGITANSAIFDGVIGAVPINSLTINAANITLNGASISTIQDQIYNGLVTLGNDTAFTITGSGTRNIAFNGGIAGNKNLILTGNGSTNNFTMGGSLAANNISITAVGGSTNNMLSLNNSSPQSWSVSASNSGSVSGVANSLTFANIQNLVGGSANDTFTLNGGSVTGSINGGSGTNTLVADNVANMFTITGTNAGTMTGVSSGFANIQNLTGGTSNDQFILSGGSLSGSINGGGGTNSLTANNTTNAWSITGSDAGSVSGVSGFSSIQNLNGGSGADTFSLNGGTLSGDINGGSGSNTIVGDNVSNTWNLSGTNAGSVTGIGGVFSNIQNLTGGSSGNNFIFADNANLTGSINGGSLANTNTLDFSAYSNPVLITLSSVNNGSSATSLSTIASFTNINNLVGQMINANQIYLTDSKLTFVYTGTKQGYISDPTFFNGFDIFGASTPIEPGAPQVDVSPIIQQPMSNDNALLLVTSSWIVGAYDVNSNLTDITQQLSDLYKIDLGKIKINPYCYAAN